MRSFPLFLPFPTLSELPLPVVFFSRLLNPSRLLFFRAPTPCPRFKKVTHEILLFLFDRFCRPTACDIDLGLVIDDTKGNFSLIKNFTKHLVSKFQISGNGTRVGAITFGRKANLRLRFSDPERQGKQLGECEKTD